MWTKNLIELMLNKYRKHKNLYDPQHPFYYNREKRSHSLFQILTELRQKEGDLTVADIKTKMHTLRAQFIKEARLVASSKVRGSDVYTPRLWCFDQLKFLQPYVVTKKSTSNTLTYDEFSCDATGNTAEPEFVETEVRAETSKKRKTAAQFKESLINVHGLIAQRLQQKADFEWLGQQVVFDINSMKDKDLQRDTVWRIQSILREGILADRHQRPASSTPNSIEYSLHDGMDDEEEEIEAY